jgi:hypothetical protein
VSLKSRMNLPTPRLPIPFKPGPFRMAMGLNELDPRDWIEIDANYPAELVQKKRLLAERHAEVFAAQPSSERGGAEVLEMLTQHLASRFSENFTRAGANFTNKLTGENWDLAAPRMHPLDLAARCVQEDLCLMQVREGVAHLAAASVCFPSRWKLHEKIGTPMSAIHGPVPFYEKIAAASDRFLSLLAPNKLVWRVNWSLHDSPELFQPVAAPPAIGSGAITAQNAGEFLWLRTERQTLRRLPLSGDILFTIRTYVRPLRDYVGEHAPALADALRNLPPETIAYKGLRAQIDAAIQFLKNVP